MQIIHWGRARKFFKDYPAAKTPLKQWRKAVIEAQWNNFPEVRTTFTTAYWVDGRIVFDIKGNSYRLIAVAAFEDRKLYIREIMTHEKYDRGAWKS